MNVGEEAISKQSHYIRIWLCVRYHGQEALLNVLHNKDDNPRIKGLPEDPEKLYMFLKKNEKKIGKGPHLRDHQRNTLLPNGANKVDSKSFDISLLRYLIKVFFGTALGKWESEPNNTSIASYVVRLAEFRNNLVHVVDSINENNFDAKWSEMEDILKGLSYQGDFEYLKTCSLDSQQFREDLEYYNSLMRFDEIISEYKTKCQKEGTSNMGVHFTRREYKRIDSDVSLSNPEELLEECDTILISGIAGSGKSTSAQQMRFLWASDKILKGKKMIYYDAKDMNMKKKQNSFFAPIFFSGIKTKTSASIEALTKEMENIVIIIDGVDELRIADYLKSFGSKKENLDELEAKILDNEKISGFETIIGIYLGYLFPRCQIFLFGRDHEMSRLKEIRKLKNSNVFNHPNRRELELLDLSEEMIKEFISQKQHRNSNINSCSCQDCTDTYQKIKDIELIKVPAYLVTYMDLEVKDHDNQITGTQLYILLLLKHFNNHTRVGSMEEYETFRDMKENEKFDELKDTIHKIAEMSYVSFLLGNGYIDVKKEKRGKKRKKKTYLCFTEDVFDGEKYNIEVRQDVLEEIDLFSIVDNEDSVRLVPHHLTRMEFIAACHICRDKDLLGNSKMNESRRQALISYYAGLCSNHKQTKDFVENLLEASECSVKKFLRWLYDDNESTTSDQLWYYLMEDKKTPSSLLGAINREIKIPESFVRKTILFYGDCAEEYPFEWYNMNNFCYSLLNKNTLMKNYNIESYLNEYEGYNFIIRGHFCIEDEKHFNKMIDLYDNSRISFRLERLVISTELTKIVNKCITLTSLFITTSDKVTLNMLCNALTTSASNNPSILVKYLIIQYRHLEYFQAESYFKLGLTNVDVIGISNLVKLSEDEIKTLSKIESKYKPKVINFQLTESHISCFYNLPLLHKRHISLQLQNHELAKDKDLKELKKVLEGFPRNDSFESNLRTYNIISPEYPFIHHCDGNEQDSDKSFYLHLSSVDFSRVSPEAFAEALSKIPTLEWEADEMSIPSSHWERLSSIKDCEIKELRIWLWHHCFDHKNFSHFYKINTNILQFVCFPYTSLIQALFYLKCSSDEDDDERMMKNVKIFVVKCDINDIHNDEYYEEKIILKTKLRKLDFEKVDAALNQDEFNTYREGEFKWKWWCCEIQTSESE